MAGTGNETRTSILPNPDIPAKTPGVFGPDFSYADAIPLPGDIGVRDGDDMRSVADAIKGVGFYADTIGFGGPSSGLTRGMPLKPIGVNTWMKTGLQCSNGADMWMYQEGIPTGNALGKRMADGLQSAGFPKMRGLAPGILEDVQEALNPVPILSAVFGTGYPSCKLESRPVGDQDGNIQNKSTGSYYVENPDTVVQKNGNPHQSRWVSAGSLTKEQWEKAPKTHCPNGYKITQHVGEDCKKGIMPGAKQEGFQGPKAGNRILFAIAAAVGGLLLLRVVGKR